MRSASRRAALGATVGLLVVLGILDLVQHYRTDPLAAYALSVVRALPLLLYRRWPVEAVALELAAVVGTALATTPVTPAEPWPWAVTSTGALTALTGLVATRGDRRLTGVSLGVLAGLGLVLTVWPGRGDWNALAVTTALTCVAAVVGDVVHARRAMAVELAEERQVSAGERQLRSVVEERSRIARELHDVVAHHMSMITVQAETARYRVPGLPQPAIDELTAIAALARSSLGELRGLLSALRDDGADPSRAPQPGVADLAALVERIDAAGTPARLAVTPDRAALAELPRVVQLAVYRIVQEALSNVVRHAPGARTTVAVALTDTVLRVEVVNERPPGGGPVEPDRAGHGLVGLRERATLLGGTFEVDRPDGGWRVRVELPR